MKGSSLVITLFLLSFLSCTFYYWNNCYKLQISSYQYAFEKEYKETQMDLAISLVSNTNNSQYIKTDAQCLKVNVKWDKISKRYIGVIYKNNHFYGMRGLSPYLIEKHKVSDYKK